MTVQPLQDQRAELGDLLYDEMHALRWDMEDWELRGLATVATEAVLDSDWFKARLAQVRIDSLHEAAWLCEREGSAGMVAKWLRKQAERIGVRHG